MSGHPVEHPLDRNHDRPVQPRPDSFPDWSTGRLLCHLGQLAITSDLDPQHRQLQRGRLHEEDDRQRIGLDSVLWRILDRPPNVSRPAILYACEVYDPRRVLGLLVVYFGSVVDQLAREQEAGLGCR